MRSFFDKIDDYLIRNKPHLWLARIHVLTPLLVLALILLFVLGALLPIHTNVYPLLIGMGCITIPVTVGLIRWQYLHSSKAFGAAAVNKIFLLNLLNFLLLPAIALLMPIQIAYRTQAAFDRDQFHDASRAIRVAMLPAWTVASIRAGELAFFGGSDFLFYDLAETAGDTVRSPARLLALDIIKKPNSQTKPAGDQPALGYSLEEADSSNGAAASPYKYGSFLYYVKNMPDTMLVRIRHSVSYHLRNFGFPAYHGDSSLQSINNYYTLLHLQTLALYANSGFNNNFMSWIVALIFPMLITLSQFSILLFNKNNFPLLVAASLTFYLSVAITIIFYMQSDLLSILEPTLLYPLATVVVLFTSKTFRKNPSYSKFSLFSFYLFVYMSMYLLAALILLADILADVGSTNDAYPSPKSIIFLCLSTAVFLFVGYKLNYRFIRRVIWINHLPNG